MYILEHFFNVVCSMGIKLIKWHIFFFLRMDFFMIRIHIVDENVPLSCKNTTIGLFSKMMFGNNCWNPRQLERFHATNNGNPRGRRHSVYRKRFY